MNTDETMNGEERKIGGKEDEQPEEAEKEVYTLVCRTVLEGQ